MKYIGIIGSRRRNRPQDRSILRAKFNEIYEPGDVVVSGGCPTGGDSFAEDIARSDGITIIIHHANWKLGNHAGLLRNANVAEDSDVILALVAHDRTGGAEDTIKKALKLNKQVILL